MWKRLVAAMLALTGVGAATAAEVPATGVVDSPEHQALVEQVRAAETAFARTMAARDFHAFGTFIADEGVFIGGRGPQRGAAAVRAGWAKYFEGAEAPFSWRPETVEVLASGTLALTSGPVFEPDGASAGSFMSIWRLEADGKWRVVFDSGCPPCPPPGP